MLAVEYACKHLGRGADFRLCPRVDFDIFENARIGCQDTTRVELQPGYDMSRYSTLQITCTSAWSHIWGILGTWTGARSTSMRK